MSNSQREHMWSLDCYNIMSIIYTVQVPSVSEASRSSDVECLSFMNAIIFAWNLGTGNDQIKKHIKKLEILMCYTDDYVNRIHC